jgi:Concanavalin A-like lectin/glucanases superfamily/Domain of unknown function (DUF2341)
MVESCARPDRGTSLAFARSVPYVRPVRPIRSRSRVRGAAALTGACLFGLLSGCFLETDLSDTAFLCTEEPVCPDGYDCVDGRCIAGGAAPEDDGDGSDDVGGDDGDDGAGTPDGGPPTPELGFRQQLRFANLKRGELVDFPVLVALDPGRIDYGALRPDGSDLQFRDADDTPLAHHIERWDPQGTSIVWVRVPLIDAGSDSDFVWMYYGDPAAEVVEDESSTWSIYESVFHMEGEGDEVDDSGERDLDGFRNGTQAEAGFLGVGQLFDGFGAHIDLGGGRDFLRAASGFTLEAWVNPQVAQQGVVIAVSVNGSAISRAELRLELDQTLRGGGRTRDSGELNDFQAAFTGELLPFDTWSWVAVSADFEAGEVSIYIDDRLAGRAGGLLFDGSMPDTPSSRAVIGANETLDTDFFGGLLDEVRIAPVAIDEDWAAAQYASMIDELIVYGAPEAL